MEVGFSDGTWELRTSQYLDGGETFGPSPRRSARRRDRRDHGRGSDDADINDSGRVVFALWDGAGGFGIADLDNILLPISLQASTEGGYLGVNDAGDITYQAVIEAIFALMHLPTPRLAGHGCHDRGRRQRRDHPRLRRGDVGGRNERGSAGPRLPRFRRSTTSRCLKEPRRRTTTSRPRQRLGLGPSVLPVRRGALRRRGSHRDHALRRGVGDVERAHLSDHRLQHQHRLWLHVVVLALRDRRACRS